MAEFVDGGKVAAPKSDALSRETPLTDQRANWRWNANQVVEKTLVQNRGRRVRDMSQR